jgi:hypothetical protein
MGGAFSSPLPSASSLSLSPRPLAGVVRPPTDAPKTPCTSTHMGALGAAVGSSWRAGRRRGARAAREVSTAEVPLPPATAAPPRTEENETDARPALCARLGTTTRTVVRPPRPKKASSSTSSPAAVLHSYEKPMPPLTRAQGSRCRGFGARFAGSRRSHRRPLARRPLSLSNQKQPPHNQRKKTVVVTLTCT